MRNRERVSALKLTKTHHATDRKHLEIPEPLLNQALTRACGHGLTGRASHAGGGRIARPDQNEWPVGGHSDIRGPIVAKYYPRAPSLPAP